MNTHNYVFLHRNLRDVMREIHETKLYRQTISVCALVFGRYKLVSIFDNKLCIQRLKLVALAA